MSELSPERIAAVRHKVYFDLLCLLPIASFQQSQQFAANLALTRGRLSADTPAADRQQYLRRLYKRLVWLRVTPDLATPEMPARARAIEDFIGQKYGERLADVAGFYKTESGRWKINFPERCALMPYQNEYKFFSGFLCQPIDQIDKFFLLSSRGQTGVSAVRLTERDRAFFERFKQPTEYSAHAGMTADISGYRWTGRRFVDR